MRFVTFSTAASPEPRIGIVVDGDTVVDLAAGLNGAVEIPATLIDYVWAGPELHAKVDRKSVV